MAKLHQKNPTPPTQVPQEMTINFRELLQQWDLNAAKPIIAAIERKRGTKLISLIYNGNPPAPSAITPAVLNPLEQILSQMGEVPRIDLFLESGGGVTEVPWRIVCLLREFATEKLAVIVSRRALSGATHIAIAADELVMTPFSVLSSVDPTRRHPLLPKDADGTPIPTSVEDLKHCIGFIREQLGDSYSNQNLALIISELFKYINPLAIGALEQSYNLSRLITEKCLKSRIEQLTEDHIKDIVERLSGKYFSHSFLISRSEVVSDLKLPVTKPDAELSMLISQLTTHYLQQFEKIVQAMPPKPGPIFRVGGIMQTTDICWLIASLMHQDGRPIGDPWVLFTQ